MVYQNKKNILFDIYTFSLVLLFFKTFSFKFFWNIPVSVFLVFNIVCYFLYFVNSKGYNLTYIFFAFLFSVIVILQVFSNSLVGGVGQIFNIDEYNIFIKDLSSKKGFENGQYIRLAVRNTEDNDKLIAALKEI